MRLTKLLLFSLYVAVLIIMGAATFIEKTEGTDFVHAVVYGSWWFTALWAALAVVGSIYIIRKRGLSLVGFMLHASFIIILAGALLTHVFGRNGTIHLRLNEPQDVVEITHNGRSYLHRLSFAVVLKDFHIIEDKDGNATDFRSEFEIQPLGKECAVSGDSAAALPFSVSMNNIAKYGSIRFYQSGYDSDERGSTLMINRDPYGIPVTYCGYALLFLSFICLCFRSIGSLKIWLPCIALTALWCIDYFVLDGSWTQIPVLRHPLLFVHVIVIILAYALLLIQTVISAWALIRKKERLYSVMRPALCLLCMGIFLGAIWANISWGNYWSWDSKEVWALITLMIYAIPIHKRSLPIFSRPRVYHVYMVAAFLTVLMTYFGVSYFLTGLHSYN